MGELNFVRNGGEMFLFQFVICDFTWHSRWIDQPGV